jgi:hypothetical protein
MFFFTLLPFFWAGWLSSIPFVHYSDDVPHQGHPGECQQEIANLQKRIEAVMEADNFFF